jgi:hypothetical protein
VTISQIPTRMLVLLGLALAGAAAFLVVRPAIVSDSGSSSNAPAATATGSQSGSSSTSSTSGSASGATQGGTKAAPTPKIVLLPGLPVKLEQRLRYSRVVVVSVYAGTSAGDLAQVAEARQGAGDVGAGFVALNVLNEATARQVQPFIGTASPPVLLVVRRPGKVVSRIDGTLDAAVVAQAARNAGAGR